MFNGFAVVALTIVNRNGASAIWAFILFYLVFYELGEPFFRNLQKIGNWAGPIMISVSLIDPDKSHAWEAITCKTEILRFNMVAMPLEICACLVSCPAARTMGNRASFFWYSFGIGKVAAAHSAVHAARGDEVFRHDLILPARTSEIRQGATDAA
jgi:hypothetical protein